MTQLKVTSHTLLPSLSLSRQAVKLEKALSVSEDEARKKASEAKLAKRAVEEEKRRADLAMVTVSEKDADSRRKEAQIRDMKRSLEAWKLGLGLGYMT